MIRTTTELHRVQNGQPYTWGKVEAIHEIGPYAVIEYLDSQGSQRRWAPYVDEKETHHSYESLDAALAGAIAHRHEGPNSQAARYFLQMIGAMPVRKEGQ